MEAKKHIQSTHIYGYAYRDIEYFGMTQQQYVMAMYETPHANVAISVIIEDHFNYWSMDSITSKSSLANGEAHKIK